MDKSPREIAEDIFNFACGASFYVHKREAIRRKKEQIKRVTQNRCGNCSHWMKSTCVPEKKNGQFKSCDSFSCKDFDYCSSSKRMADKFTEELNIIESQNANEFYGKSKELNKGA